MNSQSVIINNAIEIANKYHIIINDVLTSSYFKVQNKETHLSLLNNYLEILNDIYDEIKFIEEIQLSNIVTDELIKTQVDLKIELNSFCECNILNKNEILKLIKGSKRIYESFLTKNKDTPVINKILDFFTRLELCCSKEEVVSNNEFKILIDKFNLISAGSLNFPFLKKITTEPGFDAKTEPNVIPYDLRDLIEGAITEITNLLSEKDAKIKCLRLSTGALKLQVGADKFHRTKFGNWEGWIFKGNPSKRLYKDLVLEDIPAAISAVKHDLMNVIECSEERKIPINQAFELLRTQRTLTIKRNIRFFEGWPKNERAFISLKSRYKKNTILTLTFLSVVFLIYKIYFSGTFLSLLRFIDITVALVLFGVLFYIIYLILYGRISKGNQFIIEKKDLARCLEEKHLNLILSDLKEEHDCSNNIYNLKDEVFYNMQCHPLTRLSLFFYYLDPSIKQKLIQKLNLKIEQSAINRILIDEFYKILCNTNKTDFEKGLISEAFPMQLIVIPAVNDHNIIELVNLKIKKADYPNIKFLLALEERDELTYKLVTEARESGALPSDLIYYFGPIETNNQPGLLRKPKNKPKNVNKSIAYLLCQIEGLIDSNDPLGIKKPDYFMIWDLEDDPGKNQIWNMIIANTMIKSSVDKICSLEDENTKAKNDFINLATRKHLKNNNKELYEEVVRWGMNLPSIKKLYKKYLRESDSLSENNPDKRSAQLMQAIGIKADIDLFNNLNKELLSVRQSKEENILFGLNYVKNESFLNELKEKVIYKYSACEIFVKKEFARRTMPADTQGILIAKMYGDSPMSPLEWEFWFDLALPGLMSFKFDKLIIPLAIIGAVVGGILGGILGILIGIFLSGIAGYLIGKLILFLGIDTQNKVALSYSAGTTNNYNFDTLIYDISAYPEYNVAEDWAVAINLAKKKYQGLLINGYETPTYEDSLAPLGPPMWAQRSRWLGGHFQSFPQIFVGIRSIFKDFGLFNWFHSFVLLVLFSITPLLAGYTLLKFLFFYLVAGLFNMGLYFKWTTFSEICLSIKNYLSLINWWIPDSLSGTILLFIGPLAITALGIIPILIARPDEDIMIDKSIDDLKRNLKELQLESNADIIKLRKDIDQLSHFGIEFEQNKSEQFLKQKMDSLIENQSFTNEKKKRKKISTIWDDPEVNKSLLKIYSKADIETSLKFEKIAQLLNQKFDDLINEDIGKLDKRIKKLEVGRFFFFDLGKKDYSKTVRLIMNFGMVYYYYHCFFAVVLYFNQVRHEMDNQWIQTAHRSYGMVYNKKIKKEILKLLK